MITNVEQVNGHATLAGHLVTAAGTRLNSPSENGRAFLDLLRAPKSVFEIRALDCPERKGHSFRRTASGYFYDHEVANRQALACDKLEPAGVYVLINPCKPDLLARSTNHIKLNAKNTTTDADILRRTSLFIDIDSVRPSGISATDSEKAAALDLMHHIVDTLVSEGWPEGIRGMSGNGGFAVFRIDLPNDDSATELIRGFLRGLAERFNTAAAIVDLTTYNAAQIMKLPGTTARKGTNFKGEAGVEPRPHRRAFFWPPQGPLEVVSEELLRKLYKPDGKKSPPTPPQATSAQPPVTGVGRSKLLVERYLADRGMTVTRTKSCGDGTLYILERCPFNESHGSSNEVCVTQAGRGGLKFECKHNSCAANGWNQFRKQIGDPEPQHYDPPLGARSQPKQQMLAPGTSVRALDRDNFGSVVEDQGASASVHFVSDDGKEATVSIPKSQLVGLDGQPIVDPISPLKLELINSADFAATIYRQRFLVKHVLVEGLPTICGGRAKGMKTTTNVDLAVSLGSGTPFLNTFESVHARVAMVSGESGEYTIQETANRICANRGIRLSDCDVMWGFNLPQIARPGDLEIVHDMLLTNGIEVMIIDPIYLALLAGDVKGRQASNLFDMGPLLLQLTELGKQTNTTIILLHHCRKNLIEPWQPPELEDLSMAGFAEWARQWLLLGRRAPFVQGTGEHKLWLNVGGSAGHSGCWAIDINEGQLDDHFQGRTWNVQVLDAGDAKKARDQEKQNKKAEQAQLKELNDTRRLFDALKQFPEGETAKQLREVAGLNNKSFSSAILNLLKEDRIERIDVIKAKRTYEGYKWNGK